MPDAPDSDRLHAPTRVDRTSRSASPLEAGAGVGEELCPLIPGERCGSRYRLIEKLGAGGMGEVWKARDEALGQLVALKFLGGPFRASAGPGVELLRNEVRLARRVTHPNVCRVHDLGQIGEQTFLSMELVDGESLDSLMRRIGRPTPAKCRDIARQLAAGLHAAHEQGVLHRDLKPANVMLDGRGDVRITDFGIAGLAHEAAYADRTSGTPAYMAPELFSGAAPSVASDLWSLGALLYELFTGQRLIRAETFDELLQEHRRPVSPPSRLVPDLEPELETLILDLLERDPAQRPRSALAVLSRLSGHDLLAEALRSGKTPSADVIAAAAPDDRRCTWRIALLALLLAASFAGTVLLEDRVKLVARVPLPESAEVLASLARRQLAELDVVPSEADRAYGFDVDSDYLRALVERSRDEADAFDRLADADARPAAFDFWYRTAPQRRPRFGDRVVAEPLVADHLSGVVTWSDPPLRDPGMVRARFDPLGRLVALDVVPPELAAARDGDDLGPVLPGADAAAGVDRARAEVVDRRRAPPRDVSIARMFAVAGLAAADFAETEPSLVPSASCDAQCAFRAANGIQLEAGFRAGHVVWLRVFDRAFGELAAEQPVRAATGPGGPLQVLRALMLVVAVVLASRALRARRADAKGALRLGLVMAFVVLAVTLLTGNHSSDLGAAGRLWLNGMARGLLVGVQYAAFYLALEAHVRRVWPETLIAWARLLRGRVLDPAVGYSTLAGLALGAFGALAIYAVRLVPATFGDGAVLPLMVRARTLEVLAGPAQAVGAMLEIVAYYADFGLALVLGLVLLRDLLRSRRAAAIAMGSLLTLGWSLMLPDVRFAQVALLAGVSALTVAIAVRAGLLALMVALFAFRVLTAFPLRTDLDHWLGPATLFAASLLLGGGAVALWASLRVEARAMVGR
ncbi:MAG: serine/threonine protein kinase [Planctomycetes bacterium]|nr:serine/threonine protein kinase [Planctomycetota bacterium]